MPAGLHAKLCPAFNTCRLSGSRCLIVSSHHPTRHNADGRVASRWQICQCELAIRRVCLAGSSSGVEHSGVQPTDDEALPGE